MKLENVKVLKDSIWYDGNEKLEVSEVSIRPNYAGEYHIEPKANKNTFTYGCRWEELSIKQVEEGLYHVGLWSVSSQYVRSDSPFLLLEMTREQLIEWNSKDVWFNKELHYLVRRKGKKVYKDNRCVTCRRLLLKSELENHSCESKHYTVDEDMNTVV